MRLAFCFGNKKINDYYNNINHHNYKNKINDYNKDSNKNYMNNRIEKFSCQFADNLNNKTDKDKKIIKM